MCFYKLYIGDCPKLPNEINKSWEPEVRYPDWFTMPEAKREQLSAMKWVLLRLSASGRVSLRSGAALLGRVRMSLKSAFK